MAASRSFTFLGTGTSVGVPMIGCDCPVCRSDNPRNHRYRCAVLIRLPGGNLLIDTPPELRLQLLREKVRRIDAVLITHYHVDHLYGLDDLRPCAKILDGPLPLYCNAETEERIRRVFAYAFHPDADKLPPGSLPRMRFERIETEPFTALGQRIVPIPLDHAQYRVLGFRIDDVAYCTDVNHIPEESWSRLQGLRILVLDALRRKPHPGHFSVDQALEVIQRLRPERAFLTHMGHELDHDETNRSLPAGVELAYDGLTFEF
ncbi:MAG: hydrolase [Gemmatales bacterium]|nr:MAG: hydrolase [Gemmatales bacterium]